MANTLSEATLPITSIPCYRSHEGPSLFLDLSTTVAGEVEALLTNSAIGLRRSAAAPLAIPRQSVEPSPRTTVSSERSRSVTPRHPRLTTARLRWDRAGRCAATAL